MKRIKVGILGSTGIVGQQFIRMLSGHPYFDLTTLSASPRHSGKHYTSIRPEAFGGELSEEFHNLTVVGTGVEEIMKAGTRVFFSALPAETAGPLESVLRKNGVLVFSNASSHRMDDDCPILIADINPGHLELIWNQVSATGGGIVPGSNCSTSGLAIILKPLLAFGIRGVSVTTFQSISGAGRRGLAAIDISENLVPFIKGEEEKMEMETRKILGDLCDGSIAVLPIDIRAGCCRVPIRDGHLLHVEIELKKAPDPAKVLEAMSSYRSVPQKLHLPSAPERPLILREEGDRPQPIMDLWAGSPMRARGMAVTAGRIRVRGCYLNLFALVHNTVRGAAGTCLLNAELAFRKGIIH